MPRWPIGRTRSGSAYTPRALSASTASSSQLSQSACTTSRNSSARSYRAACEGWDSWPKFAAASAAAVVTTFQPARPPLMVSSVANRRARLYGSSYVVDAVATRPTRSVTAAIAASSSVGSRVSAGRRATELIRDGLSAKNTESMSPRSARTASPW